MRDPEKLSASLEDYLEAIYHIVAKKQAARAKDISIRLKVSNSSVTGALRSLAEKGLINYAPYDIITLTAKGNEAAKEVVRRHETLRQFFVKILNVGDNEGEKAACKVEHTIPSQILERFVKLIEFMELCPRGNRKWAEGFQYYCEHGELREKCSNCPCA